MKMLMTGSEWFESRPGGLNRYFNDFYGAMSRMASVQVDAVAFGDPPATGLTWGAPGGNTARRFLASSVDPRGYDVIDRHFSLYGRSRTFTKSSGALSVVHFHGPWAAESAAAGGASIGNRMKALLENARYLRADVLVVLSEYFQELLVEQYGVDHTKVRVIAPGVTLPTFDPAVIPSVRPIVLCVRRLEKRMGIDVLIDSWDIVKRAFPDAELRVVGEGSQSAALRAQAAGTDGSITFLGRVSDAVLAEEYTKATATVVPSLELEGFGLIALESLARGRAPIVTDCGGLPESVRGLDPSLVVPRASREALGVRLVEALSGKLPSAEACAAHASTFGWDVAARRHLSLYEEMS
jgi:glycosyltransferase involved in cell wall biosynthesis